MNLKKLFNQGLSFFGKGNNNMPMEVEKREQSQSDSVVMAGGKEVSIGAFKSQLTDRGSDFVIPGQRLKNGGKVPLNTNDKVNPKELLIRKDDPKIVDSSSQKTSSPAQVNPQLRNPQNNGVTVPISLEAKSSSGKPLFYMYKVKEGFYLYIELPGVIKESIKFSMIGNDCLVIEGDFQDFFETALLKEMQKKNTDKKNKKLILEQKTNSIKPKTFKEMYKFPNPISASGQSAEIVNGILEIYLPIAPEVNVSINIL